LSAYFIIGFFEAGFRNAAIALGIESFDRDRVNRVRSDSLAHSLRDFVDSFFGGLLNSANCLIRLASIAKLVAAGQRTRRFFDSTLHDVCLATHDDDSFSWKALSSLSLYSAQKNQYEQNHNNESKPAAWVVTPVFAMGPRG
jgi:hypothetical protein